MVSIICCSMRQEFIENVFRNYESQICPQKELIVILNNDQIDIEKWRLRAKQTENVSIFQVHSDRTLGECLNLGIGKARYNTIAKFDDDDYYAPAYLVNSIHALERSKADIIGKRTIFMYFENEKVLAVHKPGKENIFVKQGIKGATLVFKKEVWEHTRFPALNLGEDTFFLSECAKKQCKIFSGDKYHYVCLRFSQPGHHTWNIGNHILLRKSSMVCETEDFRPFAEG
ncbi:glycosyltransferase family 2 protein [Bacillus sp. ISL-47]|uniref:glycosyltransferase n=1 Tax=Bacillus sp. ISL-47 TaxID=2819130 RepID=UPI001BE7235F|nr:glycosyltransferase family A protein [Bacillus sp. ISL-47]MBT2689117.1 glycosyltransferase family 2 protein [Bacillus sp. ISL-47]MBT2708573.1 glycosyltransferase family 2 protein [Pseudomonas sp. ISL-84]